jgi:hypothetical protein
MTEKFIDHSDDPFNSIQDIEEASLEQQYSKLDDHSKLIIACKAIGYRMCPPSIERFYSDEYYLGNEYFFNGGSSIFPYWKEKLNLIYPSPVLTAKPFQILSGAIGQS